MKTALPLIVAVAVLCAGLAKLNAADKMHLAGPKGGRLLEKLCQKPKFYLGKDHTVTVTFYDTDLKPVPATSQSVTVIADAKGGKATVEFEKKGDALVSKTKLPEGDGFNVVLLYKQTADAESQNFRFKLETHD